MRVHPRHIPLSLLLLAGCRGSTPSTSVSTSLSDNEPGIVTPVETFPEEAFPGRSGPVGALLLRQGVTEQLVQYQQIDGWAVMEGDILLGRVEDLEGTSTEPAAPPSAGRTSVGSHWPDHRLPFRFRDGFSDDQKTLVRRAADFWNSGTEIEVVELAVDATGETDLVEFYLKDCAAEATAAAVDLCERTCASRLGMTGGVQEISVGSRCGDGNLAHELGHALGLFHEQSRSDRDEYVDVNSSIIQQDKLVNFQKYTDLGYDGADLGPYEYDSIMHYSSTDFREEGESGLTLTKKDGSRITEYQRTHLSDGDKWGVTRMYFNTWQVSYGASWDWALLAYSDIPTSEIRAGRFNHPSLADEAETATDLIWVEDGVLRVWWGEDGSTAVLRHDVSTVADLAIADVDGDGFDDLLRNDRTSWKMAAGGTGSFVLWSGSSVLVTTLAFADVNGDGTDDAIRSNGTRWEVMYGATGRWTLLSRSGPALDGVLFGDFTGDGLADAVQAPGGTMRMWNGATQRWTNLPLGGATRDQMLRANLDGDNTDDIIVASGSGWSRIDPVAMTVVSLLDSDEPPSNLLIGNFDGVGGDDVFAAMPKAETDAWIEMTGPLAGDTVYLDFPTEVGWTSSGGLSPLAIRLYLEDGTWVVLAEDVDDDGIESVSIGSTEVTEGSGAQLCVGPFDGRTFVDCASGLTIRSSYVDVIGPEEGATVYLGDSLTVSWDGGGVSGVDLELRRDGVVVAPITTGLPVDGSYTFLLESSLASEGTGYQVCAWADTGAVDGCSGSFTVASPLPADLVVPDNFSSIGEALTAAEARGGGMITVHAGTYNETLRLTTPDIEIIGDGADVVTIQGDGAGYGVINVDTMATGVRISGVRVVSTSVDTDGGILVAAPDTVVSDCAIEGSATSYPFFADGSDLFVLERTVISGGVLGVIAQDSAGTVDRVWVDGQSTAGMYFNSGSTTTVTNSFVVSNYVGVYVDGADPQLYHNTMAYNTGPGLYCTGGIVPDSQYDYYYHNQRSISCASWNYVSVNYDYQQSNTSSYNCILVGTMRSGSGTPSANWHLESGSNLIDAGSSAPVTDHDYDGDPRPQDGNGDGTAKADVGADEWSSGP